MVFGFGKITTKKIEKMERKKDVKGLIKALDYGDFNIRRLAAMALGEIGDSRAAKPLIDALKDEDQSVRSEAEEALDNIDWNPETIKYRISYLMKIGDWNKIVDIGELAVDPLIDILIMDEDDDVRSEAAETLGKIGDVRAIPPLINRLNDEDNRVRAKVEVALEEFGEVALDPLIERLEYESNFGAAKVIGKLGEFAVSPVIEALKANPSRIKYGASNALVELGEFAVIPLTEALKDEDSAVKYVAADVLGRIGDDRAVEPLIGSLNDDDKYYVRNEVMRSLGRIGDDRAVEPLIEALEDEDEGVRFNAAIALGKIGNECAVPALIVALKDDDYNVRRDAAEALGEIGDLHAVEPLVESLKDKKGSVRGEAVEALGKIGDDRIVNQLQKILTDYPNIDRWNIDTFCKIAVVLIKMGDSKPINSLIECLNHTSGLVRETAAENLIELYNQNNLDPKIKEMILNKKVTINQKHTDGKQECPNYPNDCSSFPHTDTGIGLDF